MQIFDIPINSKRMETTRIGTFDFPLSPVSPQTT